MRGSPWRGVASLRSLPAVTVGPALGAAPAPGFDLRCEQAETPLGIDVRRPSLSWAIHSEHRSERQSAEGHWTPPLRLTEPGLVIADLARIDVRGATIAHSVDRYAG